MPNVYANDVNVVPNTTAPMTVFPNNAANIFLTGPYNGNSPSQTGLLFMYSDGKAGRETDGVLVTP
jgi:hypothetical protein